MINTKPLITLVVLSLVACSQASDMQPVTVAQTNPNFTYLAQGKKPDWSVKVHADNTLTFSTSDIHGIKLVAKRSAYAKGAEYTGTYRGQPFYLRLDGKQCAGLNKKDMNQSYDMTAVFEFARKKYRGCAK